MRAALAALSVLLVVGPADVGATPASPLDVAHGPLPAASTLAGRVARLRASPFGERPEATLVELSQVAASREPTLAPVAVVAAFRIASELQPGDYERHEVDPADRDRAADAFVELAGDESARRDVRELAALTARMIRGAPEGD